VAFPLLSSCVFSRTTERYIQCFSAMKLLIVRFFLVATAAAATNCTEQSGDCHDVRFSQTSGLSLLAREVTVGKSAPVRDVQVGMPREKLMDVYLHSVRDMLTGTTLSTRSVTPSDSAVPAPFNKEVRWQGADWCEYCFTMAGGARVQNVRDLVEETISAGVPGDWLEAGAWRGGCSIMARVVQTVLGEEKHRRTYVCDSFAGLPLSSTSADHDGWNKMHFLEVSQSEVERNFEQFVPLDGNVRFRKGYFSESLPEVRKELRRDGRQLAVLRGDGDMYESYMDILYNLYEFVSVGGYFICDDCPAIAEAKKAIEDFRKHHAIEDPLQTVDGSAMGTFWQKGSATLVNYTKYLEWNATRKFKEMD